jgi:hypothetical protein
MLIVDVMNAERHAARCRGVPDDSAIIVMPAVKRMMLEHEVIAAIARTRKRRNHVIDECAQRREGRMNDDL